MAEYPDRFTKPAKKGRDYDLIFGVIHEGIALGTSTEGQTSVTFDPATYGPFYPNKSYDKAFTADENDVNVYDDGVEVTVSAFNPTTGAATIVAPTTGSVMTGDCVEQRGLYILQNATLTPDQDDDELPQLRNPSNRKTWGNVTFTLKCDHVLADNETQKMIFQETSTAGRYEFPDEPPEVYGALLEYDASDNLVTIYYLEDAYAAFSDILKVEADGNAENGFEVTISKVIMVDVAESA
jgi:hypothetical protein